MTILVLGYAITASHNILHIFRKGNKYCTILTRLEFIVAVIWFATQFVVTILYYYSALIGFSQLIGIKDHKK